MTPIFAHKFRCQPYVLSSLSVAVWLVAISASGLVYADNTAGNATTQLSYPIIDTHQSSCVGLTDILSRCPANGVAGTGQDAQYQGIAADYTKNADATVTDNYTRLVWASSIDLDGDGLVTIKDKLTYEQALDYASKLALGGYHDWRIPSLKELYSLMMFDGQDPSGISAKGSYSLIPFIDNSYFGYHSGDTNAGERLIDSQYLSSTKYVSTTMRGDPTVFGVNFIDGRIKGYGLTMPDGSKKAFYVLAVRGNRDYGVNKLVANNNATVSDNATGLLWQQGDSERGMDWPAALAYCENLTLAGRSDWRLPNVKELQSIVDYSRSPDTTNSAAIANVFAASHIINEANKVDYPNYWSSTTHLNMKNARNAAYIAFGRSMGKMNGRWLDVHGAGSQRSDPKTGDATQFPDGHGPQGDAIRINNYVRCVSAGNSEFIEQPLKVERSPVTFTLTGQEASSNRNQGKQPANNNGQQDNTRGRGGDVFTQLDANNDNKISKQEAKGPLRNDFDRLDSNGDGYLVKSELPSQPRR